MNKELVIQKALAGLKVLKQRSRKDSEAKKYIKNIENALKKEPEEIEEIAVIKNYYNFALILDFLERNYQLKKEEIGYLVMRILKASSEIVYSTPHSLIDIEDNIEILECFGIKEENFQKINQNYLEGKEIEVPNMITIKNYLRRAFDIENIMRVSPSLGKKIKDFLERIRMTNKNPIAIKKAIQNLEYTKQLEKAFFQMLRLSKEETLDILTEYLLDQNLEKYQQKRMTGLKETLRMVNEKEEQKRLELVNIYTILKAFLEKEIHSNEDYKTIINILQKDVPRTLISSLLWYIKLEEERKKEEQEKKKTKTEGKKEIKSRKKWKQELKELYGEDVPFHYEDFEKILKILEVLNYSDEIKIKIWNTIYVNAIKNKAYYQHIFEKNKYYAPESNVVRELGEMLKKIKQDETEEISSLEIISLGEKLQYSMTCDFDYEMEQLKRIREKQQY